MAFPIKVKVNGEWKTAHVEPEMTLLEVLREQWGLTGTKMGCDEGDCGACTVLFDGKPVNSCLILAVRADGHEVVTVEGLGTAERPHPLQVAFQQHGAVQCGFCAPGMLISAKALLDVNPEPTDQEIREALAGNLCRCTGYTKIVEAVKSAGRAMKSSAK